MAYDPDGTTERASYQPIPPPPPQKGKTKLLIGLVGLGLLIGFLFGFVFGLYFVFDRVYVYGFSYDSVNNLFGPLATAKQAAQSYCMFIVQSDYQTAYTYLSSIDGSPVRFSESEYARNVQSDQGKGFKSCGALIVADRPTDQGMSVAQATIYYQNADETLFAHQSRWFQNRTNIWHIDVSFWDPKQYPVAY